MGPVSATLGVGLNAVVHEVYRRHGDVRLPAAPDQFDREAFTEALQAVPLGNAVRSALDALDDVCCGTRRLEISGRDLHLPFTDKGTVEHEAWKSLFTGVIDPHRPRFPFIEIERSEQGGRLWEMIHSKTLTLGKNRILYTVPRPVEGFCAALADRAVSTVELPLSLRIGGYSLDEFRQFYRCLYKRCAIHQAFCYRADPTGPGEQVAGSLPLWLKREDLHEELVSGSDLAADSFNSIVTDLTYDVSLGWTDIHYQPLLPVGPGRFLVAPTLPTVSAWERNLAKMWANKHASEYSRNVSEEKKRTAETIAGALRSYGFTAPANREFYLKKGVPSGEVDVVAYDPQQDVLLLAEVKWLIGTTRSHDARKADSEIEKGIQQVREAAAFVGNHPEKASGQILGDRRVQLSPRTKIRTLVIGRGYIGSFGQARHDATVLDFHRVLEYICHLPVRKDLAEVVDGLERLAYQSTPVPGAATVDFQFELGEYRFHIPAFKFTADAFETPQT